MGWGGYLCPTNRRFSLTDKTINVKMAYPGVVDVVTVGREHSQGVREHQLLKTTRINEKDFLSESAPTQSCELLSPGSIVTAEIQ